jgi:hypothetical protein
MTEVQVRLSVPEDMHKKILRLQGLFAFKEGKKTKINDLYERVLERGIIELMKQNT